MALLVCSGPYWWFPLAPHPDVELNLIYGKPIVPVKTSAPTQEEIDQMHAQYIDELTRIFNKHKASFGYPDYELQVR